MKNFFEGIFKPSHLTEKKCHKVSHFYAKFHRTFTFWNFPLSYSQKAQISSPFQILSCQCEEFFRIGNFLKQKKTVTADKGQTISRPSCLTVTVTRIFHRLFRYIDFCPTTSAGTFPTIRNTFFRDMKRFRLFVL